MNDLLAQRRHDEGGAGGFRADLVAPAPAQDEAESGWLLVYLDVMTLLLVLFVVLLAFAEPDPPARPSGSESAAAPPAPSLLPLWLPGSGGASGASDSAAAGGRADAIAADAPSEVSVVADGQRVSLRIPGSLLFDSGSADVTGEGRRLLDELVPVLRDNPGAIAVEGHTDDQPITTPTFPSNWELSAARATGVVRYLAQAGVPAERMRAVGRADTDPVAPNTNAPGRAANRRVDILLRQPEG